MKKIILSILIFTALFLIPMIATGQDTVNLENPIKVDVENPSTIIGVVIKSFLGVVGGVALVMMVYGGFQWLTAAGNEEKIKSGTQTMLWAAIGLILVFSSYLLVSTVFQIVG
ncbi:MAG TPA: hypothetical protein PKH95_02085 [Candidatus Magasanikbacteria bacterium]|nr:hypothetical protein [Candidatus Magasanikbacteria bacterium]